MMATVGTDELLYDLGAGVRAFSTRRSGGCSKGNYASFNINTYAGDDEADIRRNREVLCRKFRIADERLVMPHQTHGAQVAHIDENFFALPASARMDRLEGVDALITRLPSTCIGVSTADCIPVLLYDAGTRAVAAVHAGWRGTVAHIVLETLSAMTRCFGTVPSDVRAAIGPGISLDAFEVGDEVYDAFAAAGFAMGEIAGRYSDSVGGAVRFKWHIDLWEANRRLLLEAGVPDTQIQVAGVCTFRQYKHYFSARRLGVRSGRIFNGIFLYGR